jgi:hypothetical protein
MYQILGQNNEMKKFKLHNILESLTFIIKNSRLLPSFNPTLLLCSRNFGQPETLQQIVLIQVGEIWGIQQKLILCRHSTRAGGGGGGQPSCQ